MAIQNRANSGLRRGELNNASFRYGTMEDTSHDVTVEPLDVVLASAAPMSLRVLKRTYIYTRELSVCAVVMKAKKIS